MRFLRPRARFSERRSNPLLTDGTLSDGDLNSPLRFAITEEEETRRLYCGFFFCVGLLGLLRKVVLRSQQTASANIATVTPEKRAADTE